MHSIPIRCMSSEKYINHNMVSSNPNVYFVIMCYHNDVMVVISGITT